LLRFEGHSGGFAALAITVQGDDNRVVHDGGTILLLDEASGASLTEANFIFA